MERASDGGGAHPNAVIGRTQLIKDVLTRRRSRQRGHRRTNLILGIRRQATSQQKLHDPELAPNRGCMRKYEVYVTKWRVTEVQGALLEIILLMDVSTVR